MMLKRWLLLALIALVVFGVAVAAQEDDEAPEGNVVEGQRIEEVAEGVDAEEAAEDMDEPESESEQDSVGLKAQAVFPKYPELRVPAGETVEVLVPITNALSNPSYRVVLIAGHIAMLDHSRYIQNFSAQAYVREVQAGETATVKYTVTPDVQLDPMEYAFVVAAYVQSEGDSNATFVVSAYNGTMLVVDPLGFDFKGLFTMAAFFGAIGGGAYYYLNKKQAAKPAIRRTASTVVETGTKNTAYDPEFVDKSHMEYLERSKTRGRSASPKK